MFLNYTSFFYFLFELGVLNSIANKMLIPHACNNPISLIPFIAGTNVEFQSHIVGNAIMIPTPMIINKAAIAIPNNSAILSIFLIC